MCPDPQLLSIYLDGELPSPWKEKMQEHFAQCPKCKEKLENFKRLQYLFKKETSADLTFVEHTKERVWEKIENKIDAKRHFAPRSTMWRRRLSIPLPVAAAAAIVIMLLTTISLREPINNRVAMQQAQLGVGLMPIESTSFTIATEMEKFEEIPGILPTADISGILQFLTPNTGTNIIILQLPESKNFFRAGDPTIVRAADFSRRMP
ncbi:MAG: zf-HC2 domain-containing protein [Treponema sp.]|jgi:predicted anti-sigma-YlaC factor YlaD|nr:zf-HC2 domain-containing protein [Treponema sp.]